MASDGGQVAHTYPFADLAGYCRDRGLGVLGYLEEIYRRFGVYASAQRSVTLPGSEGLAAIRAVMESFRAAPPDALGPWKVAARSDLQEGGRVTVDMGAVSPVDLPPSNVLVYELDDGSRVLLRPSGTEPKIKYYFEVRAEVKEGEAFGAAESRAADKLEELIAAFLAVAEARG